LRRALATDISSESRLSYGDSPTNLTATITEPGPTTEHGIAITDLQPFTKYYYSVGTSTQTLAGADPDHFFVTSPSVGSLQHVRIWAIGDSGYNTPKSAEVKNEYLNFAGNHPADVFLMLGDNAYGQGTDNQVTVGLFNNYEDIVRNTVLWPTPGNHDFAGVPESSDPATETGPYYEAFELPTQAEVGGVASGTETYYSFDYANIHFVSINILSIPIMPGSTLSNWIAADLASTNQDWVIVYLHYPSYSRGGRDSDTSYFMVQVREWINPILEQGGADLVLAGHSHTYERSKLIDGHYGVAATLTPANVLDPGDGDPLGDGPYLKPAGRTPHSGTVYVVNGVGENAHADGGALDHPIMVTSFELEGSLVVDVTGGVLNANFVSRYGDILDSFSIQKSVALPSLRAGPVGALILLIAWFGARARRRVRATEFTSR
jgi:hypothetical protein